MNIAILSAERGWHVDELERALAARGHRSQVLPIDALYGAIGGTPRLASQGAALEHFDGVLIRIIPRGSLEQMIFRLDALHRLERLGIPVLNPPAALERTVDKFYTSCLLEEAGLPTPRTVVVERMQDAMTAFRGLQDVVVKPLFGSNGRGMVRVSDEEIAYRVFRALELERAVYYLQQSVPHEGRDVRAFVVGDRVVSAVWRSSEHWRTNLARGGSAQPMELPPEWEELSLRAARAVGVEYAGVDLLPSSSGEIYVLEVNGIPGWRGLQDATGVDIAAALVDRIEQRVACGP